MAKAHKWGERIPLGVPYVDERPKYEEQVKAIADTPLVTQPVGGYSKENWDEFRTAFM